MANWDWDDLKPKKKRSKISEHIEEEDINESYKGTVIKSPLYHRYFEDYAESYVTLPNGKRKIQRVYVGKYYHRKVSDTSWLVWKIGYILIYLAALACQILAMTRNAPCNNYSYGVGPWYTAAIGLISAIPALLLLANVFSCTFAKRNLTVYGYRLFDRLIRMSFITSIVNIAYVIAVIIFAFSSGDWAGSLFSIGFAFAAAVLYAAIGFIERNTDYTSTESQRTPDSNDVVIQ